MRLRSIVRTSRSLLSAALPAFVLLCGAVGEVPGLLAEELTEKEIHPFNNDSDLLGTTAEAPHVQINEFTGKVTAQLPAVGVDGLSITPSYIAPNRPGLNDSGPISSVAVGGPFGLGWHGHLGFVATRIAQTVTSWPNGDYLLDRERVRVLEPSGSLTVFEVDSLFQSRMRPGAESPVCVPGGSGICVPQQDIRDSHFLDASFRRLTRDPASRFGEGEYVMLEPGGARRVYGASAFFPGRFYPTRIVDANGRESTVHYRVPLGSTARAPEIERITDSWGRSLVFHYGLQPQCESDPARDYVTRINLESSRGTRILANFTYGLAAHPSDPASHFRGCVMTGMSTALGHAHQLEVAYQPGEFYPFLNEVKLPTGGEVKLSYRQESLTTRIACLKAVGGPCDLQNPNANYTTAPVTQTRVSRVEHSGGAYAFSYDQHRDDPDDPDGTHPFTVVVLGPDGYRRDTRFHGPPLEVADPGTGTDYLIGRPRSRVEQYAGTEKREEWTYEGYVVASYPAGPAINADQVVTEGRTTSYRLQADGATVVVDLGYSGTRDPRLPTVTSRYGADDPTRRVERHFEYLDRFEDGFDYDDLAWNGPHQLGLVVEARELVVDGGASTPLGRLAFVFDPDFPRQTCKMLLAQSPAASWSPPREGLECPPLDAAEGLAVETTYHRGTGADRGMVASTALGGSAFATDFHDYEFGVARRVVPPLGPETLRVPRDDGQLEEETVNGVRTRFGYDADSRQTSIQPALGLRTDLLHSPPLAQGAASPTECPGATWQETRTGDRRQVRCADAWGRDLVEGMDVANGLTGVATGRYSALGIVDQTTTRDGAEVHTTYDVLGRPTRVRTVDSSTGQEIACVDTSHASFGFEHETTTVSRVRCDPSDPAVVRRTRTDMAGRTLVASTNDHRTELRYTALANGHQRIETRPRPLGATGAVVDLPSRFRTVDQLGRTVEEQHPETGTTTYVYDARNLMVEERNPAGDHFRYQHDALGRVLSRQAEVGAPPSWQAVESYVYDNATGLLLEAVSGPGQRVVKTETTAWDAMNRPTETRTSIPDPLDAPRNLRPAGRLPAVPSFYLSWTPDPSMARYFVQLRLEGRAVALRFETGSASLLLDSAGLQGAIALLANEEQAAYSAALGNLDPHLLDPTRVYEWRVRGLGHDLEPTVWSAWTALRDGCHIVDFAARDGINDAPLIEWATGGCDGGGPVAPRILASTGDLPDDRCELSDGVFSGRGQGPSPAHFMVYGYDYDDVIQAQTGSIPNHQIVANGAKDCPPLDEASFRIVVRNEETGQVLEQRPAQTVRAVFDPTLCHVENFYVNDGYDGQAPTVHWITRQCEGLFPVVRASTLAGLAPAECELLGEPQWSGAAGTEQPLFMAGEWSHPVSGALCPAATSAEFSLEIYDNAQYEGEPVVSRLPLVAHVDPADDGTCHFRHFEVEMASTSPPFQARPVIHYESRHCEDATVQVLASTVRDGFAPGCRLRNHLVSTAKNGPLAADFMTSGYEVEGQVCNSTISAAEIWIEALDAQGHPVAFRPQIRARYEGELLPPSTAGCEKKPSFGGVDTATLDAATCSARLDWSPGVSPCQAQVRYRVYRAAHSGVTQAHPDFLLADDLLGTSFVDSSLVDGGSYFYWVEAFTESSTEASDLTSGNTRVLGLQASCGGAGNTFTVSAGADPFAPVAPNTPVDLSWNLPGATYVFLPGVGELGATGTHRVHPLRTATYELFARFGGTAETSFRVTVFVDDGAVTPSPGAACDRPCSEAIDINGTLYYCRGTVLHDQGASGGALDRAPHWLSVGDWESVLRPGGVRSPYCWQAICGGGAQATNPWNPPDVPSHIWLSNQERLERSEVPRDGLDNDCNGVIDDGSSAACKAPDFYGLRGLTLKTGVCNVDVDWTPATSECGNGLKYNVYRAPHSGVVAREDMRIASGVSGTIFTDASVVDGGTYFWMVTAVDTVTGIESINERKARIAVDCGGLGGGGGGDYFFASAGTDPSQPVAPGTATDLSWSFAGVAKVFLPGVGDLPATHVLSVTPAQTSTYELWVDFAAPGAPPEVSTFRVTVYVQGSSLPTPGAACNRPCSDAVEVGGITYYCRGLELWDPGTHGPSYDAEPHWMSVGDWGDLLSPGGSRPPYCYKAKCGGGQWAIAPWNTPTDLPETWIPTDLLQQNRPEIPGDGLDNDCDRQIDEAL